MKKNENENKMNAIDIKTLVKGTADLKCMIAGGIAVYYITAIDGHKYQLDIDLSDKHDVGETATFETHYDKALILMRWIRKAIKNETIVKLS